MSHMKVTKTLKMSIEYIHIFVLSSFGKDPCIIQEVVPIADVPNHPCKLSRYMHY